MIFLGSSHESNFELYPGNGLFFFFEILDLFNHPLIAGNLPSEMQHEICAGAYIQFSCGTYQHLSNVGHWAPASSQMGTDIWLHLVLLIPSWWKWSSNSHHFTSFGGGVSPPPVDFFCHWRQEMGSGMLAVSASHHLICPAESGWVWDSADHWALLKPRRRGSKVLTTPFKPSFLGSWVQIGVESL